MIEAPGDLRPAVQVVEEGLVPRVVERPAERALDTAEPDDDARPGPDEAGRLARVLVGQRVDGDVRGIRSRVGGHGVDEAEEGAGRAPFFLVDRPALRAGAVAEAIVLGDRDDRGRRVRPEPLLEVLDQLLAHILVGQAELGVGRGALAFDLAEPLRVVGEVLLRRDEGIEGVDEALVDLPPAAERRRRRPASRWPCCAPPRPGSKATIPDRARGTRAAA